MIMSNKELKEFFGIKDQVLFNYADSTDLFGVMHELETRYKRGIFTAEEVYQTIEKIIENNRIMENKK